jgi:Xaa-Pro aminopeptidase
LIKAVVNQRSIKSTEEVAEIEKAVNITKFMHRTVMQQASEGMKEVELRGILEGIAISHGGYPGYSTILTVNGQTLHNHFYGNKLQSGQLLLGDFGAATGRHYCGDITRTVPVDKSFTSKQKDIYNLVLQAEMKGIELVQPGSRYLDVHLEVATFIANGLKDLGLMQGDVNEAVAQGAHALFFPHGLGHMLGLDVHDMEDLGETHVGYGDEEQRSTQFGLKSLRLARALQPGFVLTVEPGVYFIPELIDLWESEGRCKDFINYNKVNNYRDFGGIRIEDNVVVTQNACRVLGDPISKTVEEVEAIRHGHL